MNSLAIEIRAPEAQDVTVTEDTLVIELTDGRTISAPIAWYPRLLHATPDERNNWRLIGKGETLVGEPVVKITLNCSNSSLPRLFIAQSGFDSAQPEGYA